MGNLGTYLTVTPHELSRTIEPAGASQDGVEKVGQLVHPLLPSTSL